MIEKSLRFIAYLAVIVLCFVRVYSYWSNKGAAPHPSAESLAAHLVGSRIGLGGNATGEAVRASVVIAMTKSCVYCRASAPFYRRLIREAQNLPGGVRTIAVMPESRDAADSYLRNSLILTFDDVVQSLPGFRAAATPTLIVTDRQGVIKGAWVGFLRPEAENAVLAALCRMSGAAGAVCRS